jgi:hypothetical protein
VGGSVAPDLDDDEALGRNGYVQGAALDHDLLWWRRLSRDAELGYLIA